MSMEREMEAMEKEINSLHAIIEVQAKLMAETAAKPAEQRWAEADMENAILRQAMQRLLDAPAHESGDFACDCEWEQACRAANTLLGNK